jgi:hypothetical protein
VTILNLNDFVAVRAALGQRVADARFLARGRRNHAELADSAEMAVAGIEVEHLPAVFHLQYEDGGGAVSERVVTVYRVDRRIGGWFVYGHCHLRDALRCFNVDRIAEGFDVTTGEVFSNALEFFSNHPIYTDPRDPLREALKICKHEINLLTVVGASDGLFDPDEQDVLLLHVFNRCDHLSLDEREVARMLALVAPDQRAFAGSLTQMAQFRLGDAVALKRSLRKLVDADGQIAPEEVQFVAEIEKRLGVAG